MRVIWTSRAHVWRLHSLFLGMGYDTAIPPRAHRQWAIPAISWPHPCLHEHQSTPDYIGTVSTLNFPRFSDPSLALPYAGRHHHHKPRFGGPPPHLTPPPNRLPLGSGKDVGPTFPGSPPSAGQKRPASRRLRLPLFSPWAQRGKWAKPISRARPSSSVG
jgi:hypothetical protein